MERPTQRAADRAPRPGHEMSCLCARTEAAICFLKSESPAAPGLIPSYAALYRGQPLPTSGPKRPSTPRERRQNGKFGAGHAMRVGARALELLSAR